MHANHKFNSYSIIPPKRFNPPAYDPDPAKASLLRPVFSYEDAYVLIGSDWSIIEVSESGKKYLRTSVEKPASSILDAIPQNFRHEVAHALDQVMFGDPSINSVKTKVRRVDLPDGLPFYLQSIVRPVIVDQSQKAAIMYFEEIAVEDPELNTLTSFCDAAIIATAVLSTDGKIVHANRDWCELTENPLDECVGMDIYTFIHADQRADFEEKFTQVAQGQINRLQTEAVVLNAGKNPVQAVWHISPLPVGQKSTYILCQCVNVSLVRGQEEQLRQKNADLQKINTELEQFVYSTSHDLRAPLRSVLGLLLIMQEETNLDTLRTYMDMIRSSVNKMDNFIKELIDLSRNTRQDIKREKIDFESLTGEIVENLQYIPGAEKINFALDVQPHEDFYSDSSRLKVIISNLVSNAILYHNFAQDEPMVKVSFQTKGKYGILKVQDNGRGIKKEHQKRVFDMFYRASEDSKGSGLGLYIVKEAVNKLSGNIRIESNWGLGTTFSIQIVNLAPVQK